MARSDGHDDAPFSWALRADGSILIRYRSAPVRVLRGAAASRFSTKVECADPSSAQQLMARAATNPPRRSVRPAPPTA